MTHPDGVAHTRRGPGRLEPVEITALYDSREAVDAALRRLHDAGVPRDLIEVVVSREAADRFYRGLARAPGREVVRYGGIGGIAGLVLASIISLGIIAMPGWHSPGTTAIVQLVGPNIGAVAGAALGALIGAFRHRRPSRRHARVAENAAGILLLVRIQANAELGPLQQILTASGGRDVRVEE